MAEAPKAELPEVEVGGREPQAPKAGPLQLPFCETVAMSCLGWRETQDPSHSDQRLMMCACKERLPDVAQLLGDCPSCYLEAQAGCACPQMFLAPEGTASMPHPLPGS